MSPIHCAQNVCEAATLDSLTIENRTTHISIYGNILLTGDEVGLANARQLRDLLDGLVGVLEGDVALPERVAPQGNRYRAERVPLSIGVTAPPLAHAWGGRADPLRRRGRCLPGRTVPLEGRSGSCRTGQGGSSSGRRLYPAFLASFLLRLAE